MKSQFSIDAFVDNYLDPQGEWISYKGGRKRHVICPFNSEHQGGDAAVFEYAAGILGFKCLHNSCHGKGWKDVRALYDPPGPRGEWSGRQPRDEDVPPDAKEHPDPGQPTATSQAKPPPEGAPWPEPAPLGAELPPVQEFSPSLLPEILRGPAEDIAERMQVPLDYPAACLTLGLAGAVNRRARMQPKKNDSTWSVVPNAWGGIIAPPGFMKSPVLKAAAHPLYYIEGLWRERFKVTMEQYRAEKESADLRLAAWKSATKANLKKGLAAPTRPASAPPEPEQPRLITGDATFEKLHELMTQNPAGLFVRARWPPGREGILPRILERRYRTQHRSHRARIALCPGLLRIDAGRHHARTAAFLFGRCA
jgi:hypothetical protein